MRVISGRANEIAYVNAWIAHLARAHFFCSFCTYSLSRKRQLRIRLTKDSNFPQLASWTKFTEKSVAEKKQQWKSLHTLFARIPTFGNNATRQRLFAKKQVVPSVINVKNLEQTVVASNITRQLSTCMYITLGAINHGRHSSRINDACEVSLNAIDSNSGSKRVVHLIVARKKKKEETTHEMLTYSTR